MSELTPATSEDLGRARAVVGSSMLFVAVRCTLQYIVLPFVLPVFGLADTVSVSLSAIVELFALGLIAYNVRRLWHTDWRWRYLGLSTLAVLCIGIFLYLDFRSLLVG